MRFGFAAVVVLLMSVVAAHFDTRWSAHNPESYIGNADKASLADAARNISEGGGPDVRNVWITVTDPGFEPAFPHREPYWAVYPAYVMAPFFEAIDDGHTAQLASATLMKAIAALAVSWSVFALQRSRLLSMAAGAVVALDPSMLSRVGGQADLYFAAAIACWIAALIAAQRNGARRWYVLAGVAAGVTIGFRPPLGLVALVPTLCAIALGIYHRDRRRVIRHSLVVGVAAVVMVPWLIGNLAAFGSVVPPGWERVARMSDAEASIGSHSRAYFDPRAVDGHSAAGFFDAQRAARHVAEFANGLGRSDVLPGWLLVAALAAGITASIELRRIDRRDDDQRTARRRLALLIVAYWGAVGVLFGAIHHYEPRYWTFFIPVAAVAAFGLCPRSVLSSNLRVRAIAGVVVTASVIGATAYYSSRVAPTPLPDTFAQADEVIPDDAVVLTPNPWQFAYHTRTASVVLPLTDDVQLIGQVAEMYSAEYVVILHRDARDPEQLRWLDEGMPSLFEDMLVTPDVYVGRILPTRCLRAPAPRVRCLGGRR